MPAYVNNVVGTSKRKCKCTIGSKNWLSHWSRGTGLPLPAKCLARYCSHVVQVGAHVRHFGSDQRIIWIIPFCQYHNKRPSNTYIRLKPGAVLCGAAPGVDCA